MTPRREHLRQPDEAGIVAGIEVPAAIALLLIPIGLGMAAIAQWPERQTVARSAAHQAALLVAANPTSPAVEQQAEQAVRQAATNHGLQPDDLDLTLSGDIARGGSITARVTVRIPALTVPGLGSLAPFTWTATHTERVDDYRSLP